MDTFSKKDVTLTVSIYILPIDHCDTLHTHLEVYEPM